MNVPLTLDVEKATLQDVIKALTEGMLTLAYGIITSEVLVGIYLKRIAKDNIDGRGLRAVLELAPVESLVKTARKLDAERAAGKIRGALHGVPILIKDNIAVDPKLGMLTTAGSNALVNSASPVNAVVVDRLIAAGAIILGKTNMSVYSNFFGQGTSSGWSPRGGQTVSPHDPALNPDGSSTGSAVTLSVGWCAASIGTETFGSLTSPSKANGVYGLKPTGGLIPIMGIIPISLRQDCVGPMCKSALDLAIMLSVMTSTDYTSPLRQKSLAIGQYRLGVSRVEFEPTERYAAPLDKEADDLFDQAVEAIQAGVVTEDVDIEAFAELHKDWQNKGWKDGRWIGRLADLLLTHELEPAMNSYLERTTGNIKSLAQLIKWNNDNPDLAFKPEAIDDPLRQQTFDMALEAKHRPVTEYTDALTLYERLTDQIEDYLDAKGLDAIVFGGAEWQGIWAICFANGRLPVAAILYGRLSNKEPYGLLLMGKKGSDQTLLCIMAAMEKAWAV